ncbi:hypothetical protein F5Y07DRAFT_363414, partial [Xylaria sp. FL0933]
MVFLYRYYIRLSTWYLDRHSGVLVNLLLLSSLVMLSKCCNSCCHLYVLPPGCMYEILLVLPAALNRRVESVHCMQCIVPRTRARHPP